jgi:hypothetical protein
VFLHKKNRNKITFNSIFKKQNKARNLLNKKKLNLYSNDFIKKVVDDYLSFFKDTNKTN